MSLWMSNRNCVWVVFFTWIAIANTRLLVREGFHNLLLGVKKQKTGSYVYFESDT